MNKLWVVEMCYSGRWFPDAVRTDLSSAEMYVAHFRKTQPLSTMQLRISVYERKED